MKLAFDGLRIGFAMTGSFCTFSKVMKEIEALSHNGADLVPIMSEMAWNTDTRFGKAEEFIERFKKFSQKEIIHTIKDAEPIGPKNLLDALIIAPCTGNTISKIANGITDSSVTMAVKAHLRNNRPVVLGIATNDALGASAVNIGKLLNTKNIFFVPLRQDNPQTKPRSVVADFDKTYDDLYFGESSFEKGEVKLYVNSVGKVIETAETIDAKAGNNLYLTIDADLQKAAYDILEQELAGILRAKRHQRGSINFDFPETKRATVWLLFLLLFFDLYHFY